MHSKPTYKKQQKTTSKQTHKHLEYSNNKFINKDNKSGSNASSTLSAYSSIPDLLSPKKHSHKREQPTRASKGKLQQATKDGHSSSATQPAEGPNNTENNKDNHNALQSTTTPDSRPAQLQSVTTDNLAGDIIQVFTEDDNPEKEAFENTINKANREVEAANHIKQRYGHISIWSTS